LAEASRNSLFVSLIYLPEFAHQRFSRFGQIQSPCALVVGGWAPSREASMLKIIKERNEIRAPDPDRQADILLLEARVAFDDGQYAVLHRTDIESGKGS